MYPKHSRSTHSGTHWGTHWRLQLVLALLLAWATWAATWVVVTGPTYAITGALSKPPGATFADKGWYWLVPGWRTFGIDTMYNLTAYTSTATGGATWIALSSVYQSGYVYGGVVSAYYNGSAAVSAPGAVAIAAVQLSVSYNGTVVFRCDANGPAGTVYKVVVLFNSTFVYRYYFTQSLSASGWANNTYSTTLTLSPGTYYYVCTVRDGGGNLAALGVAAVQNANGNPLGAHYYFRQFAAAGDVLYLTILPGAWNPFSTVAAIYSVAASGNSYTGQWQLQFTQANGTVRTYAYTFSSTTVYSTVSAAIAPLNAPSSVCVVGAPYQVTEGLRYVHPATITGAAIARLDSPPLSTSYIQVYAVNPPPALNVTVVDSMGGSAQCQVPMSQNPLTIRVAYPQSASLKLDFSSYGAWTYWTSVAQTSLVTLTATGVQQGDTIAPHLYDWYFNDLNAYLYAPITMYKWAGLTGLERQYPYYPKPNSYYSKYSMYGDYWTDYPSVFWGTSNSPYYTWLGLFFVTRRPDGSSGWYSFSIYSYVNKWVATAYAFDNATRTLVGYVNGGQVYTASVPTSEYTVLDWNPATARSPACYQKIVLGANTYLGEYMKLAQSYIAVYSRALSASEVQQAHTSYVLPADGLQLFLDATFFNGTHYLDLSGNGRHGVPKNVVRIPANQTWLWVMRGGGSPGYITLRFVPFGARVTVTRSDGVVVFDKALTDAAANAFGLIERYDIPVLAGYNYTVQVQLGAQALDRLSIAVSSVPVSGPIFSAPIVVGYGGKAYAGPAIAQPTQLASVQMWSLKAGGVAPATFAVTYATPSGVYSPVAQLVGDTLYYYVDRGVLYINDTPFFPAIAAAQGVKYFLVARPNATSTLYSSVSETYAPQWARGMTYVGLVTSYITGAPTWVDGAVYPQIVIGYASASQFAQPAIAYPSTLIGTLANLYYYNVQSGAVYNATVELAPYIYVTVGGPVVPSQKQVVQVSWGQPQPLPNVGPPPPAAAPVTISLLGPLGIIAAGALGAIGIYMVRMSEELWKTLAVLGAFVLIVGVVVGHVGLVAGGALMVAASLAMYRMKSE